MPNDDVLLDPTGELNPPQRKLQNRLTGLQGKIVALLDISKPRGKEFLDVIEGRLRELGAEVKRYTKPTFTRIAPTSLKQQISSESDAVIIALAD